jgi:hypothetical protein
MCNEILNLTTFIEASKLRPQCKPTILKKHLWLMRYHYIPIGTTEMKNEMSNARDNPEKLYLSHIVGENIQWYSHCRK